MICLINGLEKYGLAKSTELNQTTKKGITEEVEKDPCGRCRFKYAEP